MGQPIEIESEFTVAEPDAVEATQSSRIQRVAEKATMVTLGLLLLVFPLFFGGVHPWSYLPAHAVCFFLLGLFLLLKPDSMAEIFRHKSASRVVSSGLIVLAAYAVIQAVFLQWWASEPHPIFGQSSPLMSRLAWRTAIMEFLFFAAVFFLARGWIGQSSQRAATLLRLVSIAALLISLIALGHWLSDSGHLFGLFPAESSTIVSRARWPFVSPNSLAQFLLPLLFVQLALLHSALSKRRRRVAAEIAARRNQPWLQAITSQKAQRAWFEIILLVSVVLTVTVAVIASLSRSAWLALGLSGALYLLITLKRIAPGARQFWRWLAWALAGAMILTGVLAFFLGAGRELVEERIIFGLTASKDDLRWKLYGESMPLLGQSWVWGVGLGNWRESFSRIASSEFAGVEPGYLHSDVLQYLIEAGLVGVLIILPCFLLIGGRIAARLRDSDADYKVELRGLLCGLFALGLTACLDFPFRIPAINVVSAICIALVCFFLDRQSSSGSSR